MRTPKLGLVITISCFALLTVGAPAGRPQPVPTPPDFYKRDFGPKVVVAPPVPSPDPPAVPGTQAPPVPSAPVTKPAPPPPTVDELLAELETVQKQKAELAKQEEGLKAKLQERLKEQKNRLKSLGIAGDQVDKDVGAANLVGRWIVVDVKSRLVGARFEGLNIEFTGDGKFKATEFVHGNVRATGYTTDPAKQPPELDFNFAGDSPRRCIYRVDDDGILVICYREDDNGSRPTSFELSDDKTVLIKLKPAEKKE